MMYLVLLIVYKDVHYRQYLMSSSDMIVMSANEYVLAISSSSSSHYGETSWVLAVRGRVP